MRNFFSKGLALSLAAALLLSGCSSTLAETSSEEESAVSIEEVREKSDHFFEGMVFPQLKEASNDLPRVILKTTKGNITLVLYPEQAPKAVENFMTHSREGYYNGTTFHRIIKDFMIQSGKPGPSAASPSSSGMEDGGKSIWGKPFENETLTGLWNFRGALSMANAGANTNGSQFFIVQASDLGQYTTDDLYKMGYPQAVIDYYAEHGGTPFLDQGYTTFGQVVDGMDVVDDIANVETAMDPNTQEKSLPTETVRINSIQILNDYTPASSSSEAP